jgi:hypothetical protein
MANLVAAWKIAALNGWLSPEGSMPQRLAKYIRERMIVVAHAPLLPHEDLLIPAASCARS